MADEFVTVSPAMSIALSLATAVRDRLATIGVPAALAEPVMVILDVDITGDSTPVTVTGAPPHPVHVLKLGSDWFDLLARDPEAASKECGDLAWTLLAPHLSPDGEPFLTRWTEQGLLHITGLHAGTDGPSTRGGNRIVDVRRYSDARRQHAHRVGPLDEPEPSSDLLDGEQPFTDLDWKAVPATYKAVETAMVAELGAGISAITAVLADLTSRVPDRDGILRLDPDRTLNDIAEWASTVPRGQIAAAVTLLTLPAGIALDWWRLEKRAHRLVTNPLLHHSGMLLTTPHLLQTTRALWAGYLGQGRLPWPGISNKLRDKVNLLATRGGDDFESSVAESISSLPWPHRAGIPFEELTDRGLAVRGEIDALVADVTRGRIWLVEAKAGIVPHAVDAIYTEVQRYHKSGGYLDRALSNAAALQAAPATAAGLLGLTGDQWQVIPLMVTRHVSPAAFVADPRVAFTVLDDLTAVLTAEEVPQAGHVPIGALRP